MKLYKRIPAVLLAVILVVMALPLTVTATDITYSYTIKGEVGYVYSIYKLADYNTLSGEYDYHIDTTTETGSAVVASLNTLNIKNTYQMNRELATACDKLDLSAFDSSLVTSYSFSEGNISATVNADAGLYYVKAIAGNDYQSVKSYAFRLPYVVNSIDYNSVSFSMGNNDFVDDNSYDVTVKGKYAYTFAIYKLAHYDSSTENFTFTDGLIVTSSLKAALDNVNINNINETNEILIEDCDALDLTGITPVEELKFTQAEQEITTTITEKGLYYVKAIKGPEEFTGESNLVIKNYVFTLPCYINSAMYDDVYVDVDARTSANHNTYTFSMTGEKGMKYGVYRVADYDSVSGAYVSNVADNSGLADAVDAYVRSNTNANRDSIISESAKLSKEVLDSLKVKTITFEADAQTIKTETTVKGVYYVAPVYVPSGKEDVATSYAFRLPYYDNGTSYSSVTFKTGSRNIYVDMNCAYELKGKEGYTFKVYRLADYNEESKTYTYNIDTATEEGSSFATILEQLNSGNTTVSNHRLLEAGNKLDLSGFDETKVETVVFSGINLNYYKTEVQPGVYYVKAVDGPEENGIFNEVNNSIFQLPYYTNSTKHTFISVPLGAKVTSGDLTKIITNSDMNTELTATVENGEVHFSAQASVSATKENPYTSYEFSDSLGQGLAVNSADVRVYLDGVLLEKDTHYVLDESTMTIKLTDGVLNGTTYIEKTEVPTEQPTDAPTEETTQAPTEEITEEPTQDVTETTTSEATQDPTETTAETTEAPTEPKQYALVGYINGADVGINSDRDSEAKYVFDENNQVEVQFTVDSYVLVKTTDNSTFYVFDKYCTDTTGTLNPTTDKVDEKMFVAKGTYTFTIVENADGTITLSYEGEAATEPSTESTPVEIPSTFYLVPNANWKEASARFSAYFYGGSGNTWVDMTDEDGNGVYQLATPEGDWTNIIFCRMNPATTENNWDNKWTQTGDLSFGNGDVFTMTEGSWSEGTWSWSSLASNLSLMSLDGETDYTPEYEYTYLYDYDKLTIYYSATVTGEDISNNPSFMIDGAESTDATFTSASKYKITAPLPDKSTGYPLDYEIVSQIEGVLDYTANTDKVKVYLVDSNGNKALLTAEEHYTVQTATNGIEVAPSKFATFVVQFDENLINESKYITYTVQDSYEETALFYDFSKVIVEYEANITAQGISSVTAYATVDATDKTTADLGEQVNFRITGPVLGTSQQQIKDYALADTMSNGLSLIITEDNPDTPAIENSSMKVYLDDRDTTTPPVQLVEGKHYQVVKDYELNYTDDNGVSTSTAIADFAVKMKPIVLNESIKITGGETSSTADDTTFYDYTTVIVEYSGFLNENAVIGGEGNINQVSVAYTSTPSSDFTESTKVYPGPSTTVYTYSLRINKVDADNNLVKLKGAEFTVYSDKACTVKLTSGETNAEGYVEFNGFGSGTYYIKETKFPLAYTGHDNIYTFIVNPAVPDEQTGDNHFKYGELANGWYNAIITNVHIFMPLTGNMSATVMMLVGGGIIILGAVLLYFVLRKKKQQNVV